MFFFADLQDMTILQKTLILSAVILYSDEKYNAYKSKCDICSVLANKLCCLLFHEDREGFCYVCVFFPLFAIAYLMGLIYFVLVVLPMFLWCGICFCTNYEGSRSCVRQFLCWPCEICRISGYDNLLIVEEVSRLSY